MTRNPKRSVERSGEAATLRVLAAGALALLVAASSACGGAEDPETTALRERMETHEEEASVTKDIVRHYELIRAELFPRGPGPTLEAEGLHEKASVVEVPDEGAVTDEGPEEEPHPCWGGVHTFVRAEKGTSCETYAAEIAGWSEHCVDECDDAARLAEAVADAGATCAAFCRAKGCPGPRYSPPDECAASHCYAGSSDCEEEWPLLNVCFLLQGEGVWNCICVEI